MADSGLSTRFGWPTEPDHLRNHRIAFFGTYNVRLDTNSNVTYDDQLREGEETDPYARDFLSHKTHNECIQYLQSKKGGNQSSSQENVVIDNQLRRELGKNYVLSEESDEDGNPVLLRKTIRSNKSGAQTLRLFMVLHSKSIFESLKSIHYDLTSHGDEASIVCHFDALEIFITKEVAEHFVSTCPLCSKHKRKHE